VVWKPRSVHFSHAAPASLHVHQRLFGTRVEFGCDFDGITIDRHDLDRPNPLGDVNLARLPRSFSTSVRMASRLPRHPTCAGLFSCCCRVGAVASNRSASNSA
jgi:hypothetical protein